MCPPWSACKGQPKRRGNTLLPLQGVKFPGYTRLPRVPLRLPWAKRSLGFQPVVPDDPIVPDFARQTGHLKKFANSLIRENIYEHCWLFMAIADYFPVRLRTNTTHRC